MIAEDDSAEAVLNGDDAEIVSDQVLYFEWVIHSPLRSSMANSFGGQRLLKSQEDS